jgi:RNA polymerase-binding transcription factor DksA
MKQYGECEKCGAEGEIERVICDGDKLWLCPDCLGALEAKRSMSYHETIDMDDNEDVFDRMEASYDRQLTERFGW